MDLKHIFKKGVSTQAPEKRRKPDNSHTAGAHELFLEYEGFLSSPKPRPRKTPTSTARVVQQRTREPGPDAKAKVLGNMFRHSQTSCDKPRISSSSLRDEVDESPLHPRLIPARQKKGFFSRNRPTRPEQEIVFDEKSTSSLVYPPEQEKNGKGLTTGWLRRCISTASQNHQPSPPPSFITVLPSDEIPIFNDENLTALPALPVYEKEILKPPEKVPSGTAARAAAAAQNEVLDTIRNLRLAEPKLTRDSESGVGIEVRDQGEVVADNDVPIVRKDPLGVLPEELVGQILSYLDAESLINAELVSIDWYESASSHHVWRSVFQSEFQHVCQTITAPNASRSGLGKALARQDWKNMWRARKALEQRWKDGHAAAIYLEGHKDSVYCVQFDEDKILTGSRDRTVRIWDARTYKCTKILGIPSRGDRTALPPLPADATDRGQRPFTKRFSQPTNVAPTTSTNQLFHTGSILCLQYDDQIMITGSSDCTLIVWDVKADYTPIMRLRRHTAGVLDVCFDHKHIVSCSKDAAVCLWDRKTGIFLKKMTGHRGPVNAVQMRGDLVVSASGDGIAKLWNIRSGLCIKEFPSRDRGMACVEFSLDSRTILAGGNDQVVYQFDTSTGELVREMKGHEGLVRSLHLDSASGRIVSGSYDTSVKAYDLRSGEMIVDFTKWTSSWILSAKSDYRRIIATSQDSRAVIMDFGYQLPGIESLEL